LSARLRRARQNLDEGASYIAADDPAAARTIVARVLEAVATLARHPDLGRPGRVPGTRELVVPRTRYHAPYRGRSGRRR
jgi:plasmid stabilization system protein ParE